MNFPGVNFQQYGVLKLVDEIKFLKEQILALHTHLTQINIQLAQLTIALPCTNETSTQTPPIQIIRSPQPHPAVSLRKFTSSLSQSQSQNSISQESTVLLDDLHDLNFIDNSQTEYE